WFRKMVQGIPAQGERAAISGDWEFQSRGLKFENATLDSVHASGELASAALPTGGATGFLASFDIPWRFAVSNILSDEIDIGSFIAQGRCSPPNLAIAALAARVSGGRLTGSAILHFGSRAGTASFRGDFDQHKAARLVDRPVQKWLKQFSWETPPR